jgi:hypothetical protein
MMIDQQAKNRRPGGATVQPPSSETVKGGTVAEISGLAVVFVKIGTGSVFTCFRGEEFFSFN